MQGNRHRPDGVELRWRQIGVKGLQSDPQLPFFIQWESPAEQHPQRGHSRRRWWQQRRLLVLRKMARRQTQELLTWTTPTVTGGRAYRPDQLGLGLGMRISPHVTVRPDGAAMVAT